MDGIIIKVEDTVKKIVEQIAEIDNTLNAETVKVVADAYIRFYVLDVNASAIAGLVRAIKASGNGKKGLR